jgi:RNA-binding protein
MARLGCGLTGKNYTADRRPRMFSLAGAWKLRYGPPVQLTAKQKQYLKGLAHGLDPIVQVGTRGISENLIEQIRDQLVAHELIKVRFNTESAAEPTESAEELATKTRSELVQRTGRMVVLYRRHDEKPKIELPKAKPTRAG